MKKKVFLTLIVVLIMAVSCAVILSGCNNEVTDIRVEDTEIFMAPRGEPSTYKINAYVLPTNAKNQNVYFRYDDDKDREFISIDSNGLVKARAVKNEITYNEYDEEVKTPIPIYIFIHSRDNPRISLKISILVEEVAVTRVYFPQSENKVFFEDETTLIRPQTIKPIVEPAHAIIGRELSYTIAETDVLSIETSPDSTTATIIPKKIGATVVTVNTRPIGAFDEPLRAHAVFQVVYAALHYSIKLDSPISALNQIQGESAKIAFSLVQDSPKSDPNPEISWYINDTPINQEGARNTVKLIYDVKNLPQGEYRVKVVLSNVSEEKIIESDLIRIYQPLRQMRLNVLDAASGLTYNFAKGDILRINATKSNAEFPPEGYQWSIAKYDATGQTQIGNTEYVQTGIKAVDEIGGAQVADLNYVLREEGLYKVTVRPIIKGAPRSVNVETLNINVSGENAGNDLRNVLVEGKPFDEEKTEYMPYITWNRLPYETGNIYVEVKKQAGADYSIQSFKTLDIPSMYDRQGIFIPSDIASLDEDFSVRIKGDRFGWTPWHDYNAKLNESKYTYFDPIWLNHNRYISNIEDLGMLLNELVIFRPEIEGMSEMGTAEDGEQYNGKLIYRFELFSPYDFNAEEQASYARLHPETDILYPNDPNRQRFAAMMIAALRTYVETTDVALTVESANQNGEYRVSFAFPALMESFKTKESTGTVKAENDLFAKEGTGVIETLPIDLLEGRIVETTDQLFYAAMLGYRPLPVENSPADDAYKIARYVIRNVVKPNMTTEEKILAIYDFISKNTFYDYGLVGHIDTPDDQVLDYDGFHIEGVLKASFDMDGEVTGIFPGKAVCDGIAKTMSLFLSMLGISNTRQVGVDSMGVAHVWNLALLNGKYYVIDGTWALRELNEGATRYEFISHKFLLTTDKEAYGVGTSDAKLSQYGKFEYKAEAPLYTGYKYAIGIVGEKIYDKFVDTEAELEYLIKNYLVPKVDASTPMLLCDIAFNLSYPVEGNFVYDLYLESSYANTLTYSEYLKENRHQAEIVSKIASILSEIEPATTVQIQVITVLSVEKNNVLALKLYHQE